MRAFIWAVLCVGLSAAGAEEFRHYDAAAVERFDDELRRLGVVLPSLSPPDEPMTSRPDPTASSPAGDFEGYWAKSQFGRPIAAFEGIPYAQPPVGPLRFKVSQPLTSKLTNFKAKSPGSKCTHRDIFGQDHKIIGSEDCLFINIYAPEKTARPKSELLPVMFWVHGGGFIIDTGANFQSNLLMDKDVVLVTFNYRLAALGFLTTEDAVIPGNLGLKDQAAALKWTYENIAAFGGNPELITVFGESAGGASTEFLMLSPLTRGHISRIIAMSGSAMAPWATSPPGEMRRNVQIAAQHLKCPAEPSQKLLECLQTKTAEEITGVDFLFVVPGVILSIPFKPVIEGDIPGAHIPHHPTKLFTDGPANDVPYMTGVTSEEGLLLTTAMFANDSIIRLLDENYLEFWPKTLMLPTNQSSPLVIDSLRRAYLTQGPLNKSSVYEVTNLFTDVYFLWPAMKAKQYHQTGAKAPSYLYYFNYEGSRSFFPAYKGVSHGDDLLYTFNYTGLPIPPPNPTDVLMSAVWTDLLSSFARDGVPSAKLLTTNWQPITTVDVNTEYLHIKSPTNITMKKGLRTERWVLLKTLLERG